MVTTHITGDVLDKATGLQMSRILCLTVGNFAGANRFYQEMLRLAKDHGADPEELVRVATDKVAQQLISESQSDPSH